MSSLIERQAAIETVRKAKSIGQAHRMLLQLPSAQPGWIPVTERLPEEAVRTIVTVKRGDGYEVFYAYYWVTRKWGCITDDVVAWMPLPKPWEGGQDES